MLLVEALKRHDKRIIVVSLLVWRLVLGILVKSSFVPDEYYQVVEPAFRQVFGKGIVTWEWENEFQIRSFVSILPYIATFNALKTLDSAYLQALVPRLVQSILGFVSDVFLYDLVSAKQGDKVANMVAVVHCLSWSTAYCLCRTLANSTETCLVIMGSSLLMTSQSKDRSSGRTAAVIIACISAYCRPTSVLIWVPLLLSEVSMHRNPLNILVRQYVPTAVFVLEVCILVDSYYYRTFTIPPLNFYAANITYNMAALFGTHPWYWNLSQGLPVVLGLYTPLLLYGIQKFPSFPASARDLCFLSGVYVLGLSVVSPHQEIRFLLPALPFLHIIVGNVVLSLTSDPAVTQKSRISNRISGRRRWTVGRVVCGLIAAVHLGGLFYLLRCHQSGTESALLYVASDIKTSTMTHSSVAATTVVHVLAPCYSFPGYSFIHTAQHPVKLNMLVCDPRNRTNGFDTDPEYHLNEMLLRSPGRFEGPISDVSYALTFDPYVPLLNEHLERHHFQLINIFRHAYFRYDYDDPYPKKFVYVYKKPRFLALP